MISIVNIFNWSWFKKKIQCIEIWQDKDLEKFRRNFNCFRTIMHSPLTTSTFFVYVTLQDKMLQMVIINFTSYMFCTFSWCDRIENVCISFHSSGNRIISLSLLSCIPFAFANFSLSSWYITLRSLALYLTKYIALTINLRRRMVIIIIVNKTQQKVHLLLHQRSTTALQGSDGRRKRRWISWDRAKTYRWRTTNLNVQCKRW